MKQISIILVIQLIVLITKTSCQSSPCPNVFQYESDGQINYGIITIPPPGVGRTVIIVKIGIRGPIYNPNSGGVQLLKSLDASVDDATRGRDVQYILNLPQSEQLPIIMAITVNNRNICNGPAVFHVPTWTFRHTFTYPSGLTHLSNIPWPNIINVPPPTQQPPTQRTPTQRTPTQRTPTQRTPTQRTPTPRTPTPRTPTPPPPTSSPPRGSMTRTSPDDGSWLGSMPIARICGRHPSTLQSTQLIINGEDVNEGEFPWLVALYHYIGKVREYRCSASLISNTYVLTAAHCIMNQQLVYMELGRHNIANPTEGDYLPRNSMQIISNPDYANGPHGDVALISIERVEFTDKIRPICLWGFGTNLDNILRQGTVTGWGQVENGGGTSTTPMKLTVRTVGLDTCRNSNELLRDIASDKTFCAGGNNSGPCHGDSGSGFYIRHNNVWFLRGIVSTSLGSTYVCNLGEYAVYVDLAYYLDWIRPYIMP